MVEEGCGMKLIVAGSRGITKYSVVRQAIIDSGFWSKYKHSLEIVSGTAKGVDSLGELFAERNGLICHKFPADWDTYGKRAGYLRNIQMGEFSDALCAIWDGKSKGTKQMIDFSRSIGLEVFVHIVQ